MRATLACLLALIALPCFAQVLYYGGDLGPSSGAYNDSMPFTAIFDDFVVPAGTQWHITGVFANVVSDYPFSNAPFTQATWSIRTGVGHNNLGTVLYSGTSPVTITLTGRVWDAQPELHVVVSGLAIDLSPGTYFLSVSPVVTSPLYYAPDATTANRVGTPGPNLYQYDSSMSPQPFVAGPFSGTVSYGILGLPALPSSVPAFSPSGYATLLLALALAGALALRTRSA